MLKNIITLTLNDVAIAFNNKTIYLIFFIPLFVFFSLQLVDSSSSNVRKINIGLVHQERYVPVIVQAIASSRNNFTLYYPATEEEGKLLLREKKLDGLLLQSGAAPNSLILVVTKKESLQTLAIVETFAALQKKIEGKSSNWISDVTALQQGGIQSQTLPTWILMLVLLVGFIIMPAQVGEEKEKKLLLALLQTPIREIEWLFAKVLAGMILISTAVLFLHLLGSTRPENIPGYIAVIAAGSFCFSSYGILLGFLCRNQASARTLGVMFYLPHLLPSALADFSQKLSAAAVFLPSYQLYQPVKSLLLGEAPAHLISDVTCLLAVGLVTLSLSYLLMKKRWLM
jgi:ABC-2 type transport system permease protein